MYSPSSSHHSTKRPKAAELKSSSVDEIEGNARMAAGIIKEETGKSLNNFELQAEGDADQFVGRAQKQIGKIKSALGS